MTAAAEPPPVERPRRGPVQRRIRKLRQATSRRLGKRFGAFAVKRLGNACTKTELGREHRDAVEAEFGAVILAVWHGRGVLGAPFYDSSTATVLVSASEDGSMATTILGKLGYEIIRGSSSRHGVRALREMIKILRGGRHVAITPDGPRGPMHSMGPGVAFLSRATGIPILPIGFAADRTWHLRSWDALTIPRPGAQIVACYEPAVVVPREISGDELWKPTLEVQTRLRRAERRAFEHLGLEPDWARTVPEAPPLQIEVDVT